MEQDSDTGSRKIVTLKYDDGTELDYMVLSTFTVDDTQYIALLPQDSDGGYDEGAEIITYRYHPLEDGEFQVETIDDDDEQDNVTDYLNELLNEEEFEELFEDIQED